MDQSTSDGLRILAAIGIGVGVVALIKSASAPANRLPPANTPPAPGTTTPTGPAPLPGVLPPSYYRLTTTRDALDQLDSTQTLIESQIRAAMPGVLTGLTAVSWNGPPIFAYGPVQWDLHATTDLTIILQIDQSATDADRLAIANNVALRLKARLDMIASGWSTVAVQPVRKG